MVGVLALFSCEQEELDNFVDSSGVGQVLTRAIGSSADFDPISELAEIPEMCIRDRMEGGFCQLIQNGYGG